MGVPEQDRALFYLLNKETLSGPQNMAADMALLEGAQEGVYLRPYNWAPGDWVSIGYRQDYKEFSGYTVCRRPSGGGIVYHEAGKESTYSIVIKGAGLTLFPDKSKDIYCYISDQLNRLFNHKYTKCSDANNSWGGDYCFKQGGGVPGDLYDHGQKIAGAAIKRTRDGVLIQGSIQIQDVDFEQLAENLGNYTKITYPSQLLPLRNQLTATYATKQWLEKL